MSACCTVRAMRLHLPNAAALRMAERRLASARPCRLGRDHPGHPGLFRHREVRDVSMRALLFALAWAVLVGTAAPGLAADPSFPALTGHVVDQAGIIPADVAAKLIAKLDALEKKASDQVVVITLTSLQGYDIADYGYRL